MRLAHLADVHLGFRQYHRLNAQGINQREADVAAAFRTAIEQVIVTASTGRLANLILVSSSGRAEIARGGAFELLYPGYTLATIIIRS